MPAFFIQEMKAAHFPYLYARKEVFQLHTYQQIDFNKIIWHDIQSPDFNICSLWCELYFPEMDIQQLRCLVEQHFWYAFGNY